MLDPTHILFEDNHILAVNKLPGQLVQGDKTGDKPLSELVKTYIKDKYNKPGEVYLGVVHRIDRPTSGVVLFARTSKAAARLSEQFQHKEIDKSYWTIVQGHCEKEAQQLVNHLFKIEKKNKSIVVQPDKAGAKQASLTYSTVEKGDRYTLLSVNIETGRHHQIRCQLAKMGNPVQGDVKYGAKRANKDRSISLHARSIEFTHPTTKERIKLKAPKPDSVWWNVFKSV